MTDEAKTLLGAMFAIVVIIALVVMCPDTNKRHHLTRHTTHSKQQVHVYKVKKRAVKDSTLRKRFHIAAEVASNLTSNVAPSTDDDWLYYYIFWNTANSNSCTYTVTSKPLQDYKSVTWATVDRSPLAVKAPEGKPLETKEPETKEQEIQEEQALEQEVEVDVPEATGEAAEGAVGDEATGDVGSDAGGDAGSDGGGDAGGGDGGGGGD